MYKLIAKLTGLRASSLQEQRGLDISEHAEIGYPEFQTSNLFDVEKHQSSRKQG
jgi:Amt family ammonium transporter